MVPGFFFPGEDIRKAVCASPCKTDALPIFLPPSRLGGENGARALPSALFHNPIFRHLIQHQRMVPLEGFARQQVAAPLVHALADNDIVPVYPIAIPDKGFFLASDVP